MRQVADIGRQGCPIPVLPSCGYELKGVGVTRWRQMDERRVSLHLRVLSSELSPKVCMHYDSVISMMAGPH